MHSYRYLPILSCIMLVSAGCASAAPALPPTPTLALPTSVPTHAPKPISLPGATAAPTPTAGPGQPVNITMFDTSIKASLKSFHAGVAYDLVIKNAGTHETCFDINPPVSVSGTLAGARLAALLDVNQNRLQPGGSVTESFTFPASSIGAHLEFSCLLKHSYDDNVRLPVTVVQ